MALFSVLASKRLLGICLQIPYGIPSEFLGGMSKQLGGHLPAIHHSSLVRTEKKWAMSNLLGANGSNQ